VKRSTIQPLRAVAAVAVCALGAVSPVSLTACWSEPAPPEPAPAAEVPKGKKRPDVIVLLWDTTRADRLSVYGHDRATTPWLEALASEAKVYDRAISPGMWTVPAHASMFTGLPAPSHGAKVGWLWLDGHHTTLAEHFGAHGYRTFAWSANPYLSPATNLLQGFDEVKLTWEGPPAEGCAKATRAKLIERDQSVTMSPGWPGKGKGWPEHLTLTKDCAVDGVAAVLAELDASDEPVFAYVNLLEAHHPRIPSAHARSEVLEPELMEAGLSTDGSLRRLMGAMEGVQAFEPEEIEALKGVYDAALRDLDDATGELLKGLESRGALRDTVVVVVGDHGEHFGEDGMYDHRWSVHQALLHVPLIVHYPAGLAAGRVSEPVSTAGLYGTLPALAGLPAPSVSYEVPTLDPPERVFSALVAPTPRLPLVLDTWPNLPRDRWSKRYQVVIEGTDKYVRDDQGGQALFDLATDPGEQTNLAPQRPDQARERLGVLQAWQRGLPRFSKQLRTPDDRPGRPMEQDDETRAMLEALGYTSGP
jgi:arylsulfatase A-like enzyme